ncbi:SDR family NAD(P)-dependent oxidoreductase [Streptomyces sp. NPDC047928]|uniref:SDR family NAD(P)-dependent oxidoreductase n=1 Tax=unclassified Streptomyces TaxID=2593676 RepID=UPI003715770D
MSGHVTPGPDRGPAPSIAVVGMACRYPDADRPDRLWDAVLDQRRAFRLLPAERMDPVDYYDPDPAAPDKTYSLYAAVLEGWSFDRSAFRVPGPVFRAGDPAHWLALETAARALDDAGFPGGAGLARDRVAVVLGNSLTGDATRAGTLRLRWPYVRRVLAAALADADLPGDVREQVLRRAADDYLAPFPPTSEESLAGALSNTIAGRICNHFDFHGGGYTVDGACASSLLAVIDLCRSLRDHSVDFGLAGGVDLSLDPFELVGFAKTGALATDRMRVYDERSAGFWPGEGCGVLALMRAADARAAGLRVYAEIRGWGVSSDGAGGITRPARDGQLSALRRAYELAGTDPADVLFHEGHGTGTRVGDEVELSALAVLRAGARRRAALGTVKANIGHTKAAAGAAGIIKAALSLHTAVVPPTTGCSSPHPLLRSGEARLRVPRRPEHWPQGHRLASVSSMGFGGINAHVVLSAADASATGSRAPRRATGVTARRPAPEHAVVTAAAADAGELRARFEEIAAQARRLSFGEIHDLAARQAHRTAATAPMRAAVVAATPDELARRAATAARRLGTALAPGDLVRLPGVWLGHGGRGRVTLLFPGQGAPATSGTADRSTDAAQPAVHRASLRGMRALEALGVTATAAVGHSLGEITALVWSGALSVRDSVRLVRTRGRLMAALGEPGTGMLALRAAPSAARALCDGTGLVVAAYNGPRSVVLAGPLAELRRVADRAERQGVARSPLPVSHAFHSPAVRPCVAPLRQELEGLGFDHPVRRVESTVRARRLRADDDLTSLLCDQVTRPVRFWEAIERVLPDTDLFCACGPGQGLASLLADQGCGVPVVTLGTGDPESAATADATAALFAAGACAEPGALTAGRTARPVELARPRVFLASPCASPSAARGGDASDTAPFPPPGVASPGVGAQGVASPGVGAPGVAPPGVGSPGVGPPGVRAPGVASPDVAHRSVASPGVGSLGVTSPGVASPDVAYPDVPPPGVVSPAGGRSSLAPAAARPAAVAGPRPRRAVPPPSAGDPVLAGPTARGTFVADVPGGLAGIPPSNPPVPVEGITDPVQDAGVAQDTAPAQDTVTAVRLLLARATELEPELIGPETRLLTDLHLTSLTVTQLAATAAQRLGRTPPAAPLSLADARVSDLVEVLDALPPLVDTRAPDSAVPGVDAWVACFTERLRPVHDEPPRAAGTGWRTTALGDGPLGKAARGVFTAGASTGTELIYVPPAGGRPPVGRLLAAARTAVSTGRLVIVAHDTALTGFACTLRQEHPRLGVTLLRVPPTEAGLRHAVPWASAEPGRYRELVLDEEGAPRVPVPWATPLPEVGHAGPLPLGPDDVLLVSGGGKGIGHTCAKRVALACGTRLALIGRSRPEHDATLRTALGALTEAGVTFAYEAADITDAASVAAAVERLTGRLGTVTAVLHAAGINDPVRFADLDERRTEAHLAPKVAGLRHLLAALPTDRLRLLVGFGSVIGRHGLPGEAHYALANGLLRGEIERLAGELPDSCRVLNLDWSVWTGTGMGVRLGVLDTLVRQDVTPIPPDTGTDLFLRLIATPAPSGPVTVAVHGRLGPGLPVPAPPGPPRRFLEDVRVHYPAVELVADARLDPRGMDAYLTGHRLDGMVWLPGVLGLEAMAQAASAVAGGRPLYEARDIVWAHPVTVPEEGTRTIRVCALRRGDAVETVLRSEEDDFCVDHFRATFPLAGASLNGHRRLPALPPAADALSPEEVYGPLCFHTDRFRRVRSLSALSARACQATLESAGPQPWFPAPYAAPLLGDPTSNDATLHALQACVPHRRLLPVAAESVSIRPDGGPVERVSGVERSARGSDYVWSADGLDASGRAVSRWRGLRLRDVGPLPRGDRSWPPALLAVLVERAAEALGLGRQMAVTVHAAEGPASSRPPGPGVSRSHLDGRLVLQVVMEGGRVACDWEPVPAHPDGERWRGVLAPELLALAETLGHQCGERFGVAATRVWTAVECLAKVGQPPRAPLALGGVFDGSWALLHSGDARIASAVLRVSGVERQVAVAVLSTPEGRTP